MPHYVVDELRTLLEAILAAMFVRLGEPPLVRLWRRSSVVVATEPQTVIELPFIESRTRVYGLEG